MVSAKGQNTGFVYRAQIAAAAHNVLSVADISPGDKGRSISTALPGVCGPKYHPKTKPQLNAVKW